MSFFDTDPKPENDEDNSSLPEPESPAKGKDAKEQSELADEQSKESFPASDPPGNY